MSSAQPAFGAMFREPIELGVVEINTKPLDAGIEWRLKEFRTIGSRGNNTRIFRNVTIKSSMISEYLPRYIHKFTYRSEYGQ